MYICRAGYDSFLDCINKDILAQLAPQHIRIPSRHKTQGVMKASCSVEYDRFNCCYMYLDDDPDPNAEVRTTCPMCTEARYLDGNNKRPAASSKVSSQIH
ncbi:unnamed protein product [Absidia cylindrospora]